MRHSLIAKSIGLLFLFPISVNADLSKNIDQQSLGNRLEAILNQEKNAELKEIFRQKSLKQFNKEYKDFTTKYKNTKWSIKTKSIHPEKQILDIKITSKREINGQIYNLHSKQTIKIETFKNKIKSYQVIKEESVLNTQKSPLVVKVISPDQVLTGQRYEINLIIEEPLDNSIIASGMIVLKNKKNMKISDNQFEIKPNESGGLFKYIQAPLEPGYQTISAIITHPDGIYLITKKIKVDL